MTFVQAGIPVQNTETFTKLKGAVETALAAARVEIFLGRVSASGLRVREWEAVLRKGFLDQAAQTPPGAAAEWYRELSASDQGLMREFYLTRIEQVDGGVRDKFNKAYRYA